MVKTKTPESKAANFEHEKTLLIGERLFDQQIKLENTSFLLNATVNIFDYFGGILPYFCLAPLVFGGIYDHLDPSDLSALISEVIRPNSLHFEIYLWFLEFICYNLFGLSIYKIV